MEIAPSSSSLLAFSSWSEHEAALREVSYRLPGTLVTALVGMKFGFKRGIIAGTIVESLIQAGWACYNGEKLTPNKTLSILGISLNDTGRTALSFAVGRRLYGLVNNPIARGILANEAVGAAHTLLDVGLVTSGLNTFTGTNVDLKWWDPLIWGVSGFVGGKFVPKLAHNWKLEGGFEYLREMVESTVEQGTHLGQINTANLLRTSFMASQELGTSGWHALKQTSQHDLSTSRLPPSQTFLSPKPLLASAAFLVMPSLAFAGMGHDSGSLLGYLGALVGFSVLGAVIKKGDGGSKGTENGPVLDRSREIREASSIHFHAQEIAEHRQRSRANITRVAQPFLDNPSSNPLFLVLGGGMMDTSTELDYPSVEFAGAGKEVVVDINEPGLRRALSLFPPFLRPRVTGVCDDLTFGMAERFARDTHIILEHSATADEARTRYLQWLISVPMPLPNFLEWTGRALPQVVVSSMLLSQLYSHSVIDFRSQFAQKFLGAELYNYDLQQAEMEFVGRIVGTHVEALCELARAGSHVYLSSDIFLVREALTAPGQTVYHPLLFLRNGTPIDNLDKLVSCRGVDINILDTWNRVNEDGSHSEIQAIEIKPARRPHATSTGY